MDTSCYKIDPDSLNSNLYILTVRTALLYQMGYTDECLDLVDLLLADAKCPKWLKRELVERRKKCLELLQPNNTVSIHEIENSSDSSSVVSTNLEVSEVNLKQSDLENHSLTRSSGTSDLATTHFSYDEPEIESQPLEPESFVNSSIAVGLTKERGCYVFALKDIEPGSVLLMEKPLISILSLDQSFQYCANCFRRSSNLIACVECSVTMFCSERCLYDANNRYHAVECYLIDYYSHFRPNECVPFIVRMMMILSKQGTYLEKLKQRWEELKKDPLTYPRNPSMCAAPDNLIDLIFYLNERKYTEKQRLQSFFKFRKLIEKIMANTKFFAHVRTFKMKEMEDFMVSLFVDLEARCMGNTYPIIERVFDKSKKYSDLFDLDDHVAKKTIGHAYCELLNFFRHSCVPNAAYSFKNGGTVTVCSLRTIKRGQRITISYTDPYYDMIKDERHWKLSSQFGLNCQCEACEKKWPTLKHMNQLADFKCNCNIKVHTVNILNVIRTACQNESFAEKCSQLEIMTTKALKVCEFVNETNMYLNKEYPQLMKLFNLVLEHGNIIPGKQTSPSQKSTTSS